MSEKVTFQSAREKLLDIAHIYMVKPDGTITFWNRGAEMMYGWTVEEAIGRPAHELLKTEFPVSQRDFLAALVRDKQWKGELVYQSKSGEKISVSSHIMVYDNEKGEAETILVLNNDITRLKQVEKDLKESENRFRAIAETAPLAMCVTRLSDGKMVFVNKAYEEMYGYAANELTESKAGDRYISADDRQAVIDKIEKDGFLKDYEVKVRKKDGTEFWASASVNIVKFAGEDAYLGAFIDVDGRKRAEDNLRLSEEKFRIVVSNTPDHIIVQDKDLRYTFVMNPQVGLTEQDMLGKTDYDFLSKEDAENLTKIKRKVMETNTAEHVSVPIASRSGKTDYFEGIYIPAPGNEGKAEGVIGYFRNITARKLAEDALSQNKKELQDILDMSPAMIFYKDTKNNFIKVNDAFCKMMSMPREKLEGRSLFDIYPEEQAATFLRDDMKVILSGKAETGIVEQVKTKDGELWFLTDKIPYRDQAGNIIGIIGFAADITMRRLAEENILRYNRVLKVVGNANQALIHAKDEQRYLDKVCSIVVEDYGHKLAWIGLAENDDVKSVRPAAQAGFDDGYLSKLNITWADSDRGRGPTGAAIRTGHTILCGDINSDINFMPWREEALKRGYSSSIALPLKTEGSAFGALMIYSAEKNPFSADEVKLLEGFAADLSYGITLIRLRVKNGLDEREIKRIATFPELNPNPICEINMEGIITYANISFRKSFTDAMEKGFSHPWFSGLKEAAGKAGLKMKEATVREVKAGDEVYLQSIYFEPGNNNIRIYGMDITARKKAEENMQRAYDSMENQIVLRTAELLESNKKLAGQIEARKESENKIRASNLILKLLAVMQDRNEYLQAVCTIIENLAGCNNVGISLTGKKGSGAFETSTGFNAGFLEKMKNAVSGKYGSLSGSLAHEMKGPGLTRAGSFYTSDTGEFLKQKEGPDVCTGLQPFLDPDYRSAAFIPIRHGGALVGMIHLADSRANILDARKIELTEWLSNFIGEGIIKFSQDENIKKSNEILERIFSFTNYGMAYLDMNFNYLRVNGMYAKTEGRNGEYYNGGNYFDNSKGRLKRDIFLKVLEKGEPYTDYSVPLEFGDKAESQVTYWDISIQPVKNKKEEAEGLIYVMSDVSGRKKMEEDLLQARENLFKSKRLSDIGMLAATIAHELRNPLGVINMASFNIRKKINNPILDKHLCNIEKKVAESGHIINNLLMYSKIKVPMYSNFRLYDLLKECAIFEKKRHKNRKIKLKIQMESIKNLAADGDPIQLKEVFSNLLTNAYQAMEDRKGTITVKAARIAEIYKVEIKDTGVGIPKENMGKIFDPFFTSKTKGTGLGLPLCKEFVELHNGRIGAVSKPGKGTVFTVELPAGRTA